VHRSGKPLGDWAEARAEIVTGAEAERGMQLLNKKYWPWKQLLDFFASFPAARADCVCDPAGVR